MSTSSPQIKKRRPLVRVVLVVVTLFAAWHIFAQFLWIAPVSVIRQVVPGNLLTSYQLPFFGQSWSVFAPDPINGDHVFKVRAIVKDDDGDVRTTNWVNASEAELSAAQHNLFPPRGANLAEEQASNYKGAYDDLNEKQQAQVALGWYEGDDWMARMNKALAANETPDNDIDAAAAYAGVFKQTDAYATQVAYAMWGDQVVFVQFDVYRQNIIPFYDRDNPDAVRPDKQLTPTGWRGTVEYDGQSRSEFRDWFAPRAVEEGTR